MIITRRLQTPRAAAYICRTAKRASCSDRCVEIKAVAGGWAPARASGTAAGLDTAQQVKLLSENCPLAARPGSRMNSFVSCPQSAQTPCQPQVRVQTFPGSSLPLRRGQGLPQTSQNRGQQSQPDRHSSRCVRKQVPGLGDEPPALSL